MNKLEAQRLLQAQEDCEDGAYKDKRISWSDRLPTLIAAISGVVNILLASYLWRHDPLAQPLSTTSDQSIYAGLGRNVPVTKIEGDETIFGHSNRTIADAAWDNWVVDPGIVALPKDFVMEKSLPSSQSWPWDHDKGIYLINGFHSLHCLQKIRSTLLGYVDGTFMADENKEKGEYMLEHSLHCIETLRQDTLCNADDTPLYTGFNKERLAGVQQQRMCRSWDQLEGWVKQYTACYRDIGRGVDGFPQIEKYKYCPAGYVFSATGSTQAPWDTGTGVK